MACLVAVVAGENAREIETIYDFGQKKKKEEEEAKRPTKSTKPMQGKKGPSSRSIPSGSNRANRGYLGERHEDDSIRLAASGGQIGDS
ncbi:hypothetical protein GY631_7297 [Trichophyton interdigitale]|nr:hypothetical protein GY631_7297 [Trichophyton interdigitale]